MMSNVDGTTDEMYNIVLNKYNVFNKSVILYPFNLQYRMKIDLLN